MSSSLRLLASRRRRARWPRSEQPVCAGVLPARQLGPVAARARQHGARHVAEPQWARKGVPCGVDDTLCAAGSAAEAVVRAM
jgi:hypothetical protein